MTSGLLRGGALLAIVTFCPSNGSAQVDSEQSSFFLARPRAVGVEVPASLLNDLQTKIKALVSRRNRLLVEGEEDRRSGRGPTLDVAQIEVRLVRARKAFDELDLASARDAVTGVSRAIGALPLTPDGRQLWLLARSLVVELADAEQDQALRDRALSELLRLTPTFDPVAYGFAPHLIELATARKAAVGRGVPVRLNVRPAGADVWIDGVGVSSGDLIRPGAHRLLIRASGHAAIVEDFTVLTGRQEVVIDRRLRPARFRRLIELDEAIAAREEPSVLLRHVGQAARTVGANLGFLVTVGKRSDERFNVVLAATHPNGRLAGVGRLVTSGLIEGRVLIGLLSQASREGTGAGVAEGKWPTFAAPPRAEITPEPAAEAQPARAAQEPRRSLRSMGMLPASRARKNPMASANFWLLSGVAVVGATAAVLLYRAQEPAKVYIESDPTLVVDVALP
jgi:hypothetical protein